MDVKSEQSGRVVLVEGGNLSSSRATVARALEFDTDQQLIATVLKWGKEHPFSNLPGAVPLRWDYKKSGIKKGRIGTGRFSDEEASVYLEGVDSRTMVWILRRKIGKSALLRREQHIGQDSNDREEIWRGSLVSYSAWLGEHRGFGAKVLLSGYESEVGIYAFDYVKPLAALEAERDIRRKLLVETIQTGSAFRGHKRRRLTDEALPPPKLNNPAEHSRLEVGQTAPLPKEVKDSLYSPQSHLELWPELQVQYRNKEWKEWPYEKLGDLTLNELFAKLFRFYKKDASKVEGVRCHFPEHRKKPTIVVSREDGDLGPLQRKLESMAKEKLYLGPVPIQLSLIMDHDKVNITKGPDRRKIGS